jgi:hypothetical protein
MNSGLLWCICKELSKVGRHLHITIPQAGKIFGGLKYTCNDYGTAITQLRILILDSENNLEINGPYGYETWDYTSTFAVFGNIKSLFGYYRKHLNGLGVFYEPWGVCGCPCKPPEVGSGSCD